MKSPTLLILAAICLPLGAQTESKKSKPVEATEGQSAGKSKHGRPALISTSDLKDFEALPEERREMLEGAIATARDSPWLPYKFGGSEPSAGGFDCSGAMFYVMKKAGLKPPRTSADQYLWLKETGRLHEVPADAEDIDHPSLSKLKPGDLLFWSGTYSPTDGRSVNITHVAMYLGREKKDNSAVMINATDGRSYKGKQANGYGVYDFRLPKPGGRSKFMGYGTPPGIADTAAPTAPTSESTAADQIAREIIEKDSLETGSDHARLNALILEDSSISEEIRIRYALRITDETSTSKTLTAQKKSLTERLKEISPKTD
jgi:peptidoglycan DL-endopeptidase CwlO